MIQTRKITELALNTLLTEDTTFQWESDQPSPELVQSLRRFGQLTPILVHQDNGHFRVLDGFKRLQALQQLHTNPITSVALVNEDSTHQDLLRLRFETLDGARPRSGLEQLNLLQVLHQGGIEEEELVREFLPRLNLPASRKLLQDALALHRCLPRPAMQGMSLDDLSLILRFDPAELPSLESWCAALQVTGNKWKTLIQQVIELRRIRQCTLQELSQDQQIEAILNNQNLQPPIRYKKLREVVERLRNPEIHRLKDQTNLALSQLNLPKGLELNIDPNFEKDSVTLKLEVQAIDDLTTLAAQLTQWRDDDVFQPLLNAVRGW